MNALTTRRRKNAWAATGALLAVAVVAVFAWRWTSGLEGGGVMTELAMDADTPVPEFIPQAAPELVDVLDTPTRTKTSRPSARASTPRPVTASRTKSKKEQKKELRKKAAAESSSGLNHVPLAFECRITPTIETHLVPDLDYGLPVTLSFAPMPGKSEFNASTTGYLDARPTLTCALSTNASGVPRLVVDHPSALRTTTDLQSWSTNGNQLTGSVTVRLKPIGLRVEVNRSGPSSSDSHGFDGTATLVALDDRGNLEFLDSTSIGTQHRKVQLLRYGKTPGEIFILGTPNSASASASILEITAEVAARAMDGSRLELPTGLGGKTPLPVKFEVVDPFGEPLKGATVTATVNPHYVARHTLSGQPVAFGEFVFVKHMGDGMGQAVRNGQVTPLNLGLARVMGEDSTGANGQAILHGFNTRVSRFTVESPFGDSAPVEFKVESTEAFQVTCAPLGAVEVHCPAVWRKDDEGRDAWARAKVKLSGKSKMLPFTKADARSRSPRRFLVPAHNTIKVTCQAKGTPKMSGKVDGPGRREITSFFPKPTE